MFGNAGSAMNLRVPHPPGFPVRRGGVNELHAAFLKESRTSGHGWGCVVGNPGSFAFFAKGGIQESRYKHSRIPPFAKSAKDGAHGGWWHLLPNAVSSPVGRQRRWRLRRTHPKAWKGTALALENNFGRLYGLKNKSRCKCELVVIGVELGGRNLHACANCNARATLRIIGPKFEFAEDDPWGQEVLLLAVILSAKKISAIRLQFWPHILRQVVLRRRIPRNGTAEFVGFLGRQGSSKGRNSVEFAKSLSCEK